ncbi:MAG: putrescine ABC transporter permease PotH [Alphaproteobacteria bacterium 41-28]|nr:MAG: putrescine ABC transporter permease PotH [Alphaproteobacteria bacterium 41-28]
MIVPYGWLLLFFLIPFLIVLKISFSDLKLGLPPYSPLTEWVEQGVLVIKLNFTNYSFIGTDALYLFTYLDSLIIAIIGTLGCLCIGYPMAYGIAKTDPPLRIVLLMMVILPFWTSFLLRVYAWIGILSPHGFLNTALIKIGLITTPLTLIDTTFATILGIIYCYLPFMILPLFASLEKIDHSLVEAAYDLGARPFQAFLRVIWPLSMPGVIAGSMLVLIPAVGEFVIPELLGGSQTLMIGKVIWNEFFTNRDWPVASALAVLMLIFLIIPIAIFQRLQERQVRFLDAD